MDEQQIFISYSRADTELMARVRDYLHEVGFAVWTDEGIPPGTRSWKDAIESAIQESDALVVLFSPEAEQSRWVRSELDYAEAQDKPIYPLLVRGTEANAVPFGYLSYQFIDIRQAAYEAEGLAQLVAALRGERRLPQPHQRTSHTLADEPSSTRRTALLIGGAVSIVVLLVALGAIAAMTWMAGNTDDNSDDVGSAVAPPARIEATITPLPPPSTLTAGTDIPTGSRQVQLPELGVSFLLPAAALDWSLDAVSNLLESQVPAIIEIQEELQRLTNQNTSLHLYIDFVNVAAYGVFIDPLPLQFSQEALIERYRGYWEAAGADFDSVRPLSVLAGEGFIVEMSPTAVEGVQATGAIFVLPIGRTVYNFQYAATNATAASAERAFRTLLSSITFLSGANAD